MRRTRLDTVLKVRRVQEQLAAGRLAAAEAESRAARQALIDRRADVSTPWGDRSLVELAWAAADRAGAIDTARRTAADEQRADWTIAARRVKALERLDERRAAQAALEDRRHQADVLDDIVTSRAARETT